MFMGHSVSFFVPIEADVLAIFNNLDPEFVSIEDNDYQLDTLSSAKDRGLMDYALFYNLDLLGVSRLDDDGPDIGAYERLEGDTLR